MSNKGEIRVRLILLIYVISCALSTLSTRVKTTIRDSTSWYFCASDILIFWIRFLLSSNSFFTENVSKVKITSIRFWEKEQRAENEILLVHIGSLRDLIHKVVHIGIHWDEQNIIIYQWRNRIIIQRSVLLFLVNDVKMMWRIMQIDEENAILLFTSLFPTPVTGLLDAISAWKRGC